MKGKPFLAEFIGTFTLIFVGVAAICANHSTGGSLGLTGIALAHGLAIAVMVSATAATSGGHLNPAVTFGALLGGKINIGDAVLYLCAQCAGAIAAALVLTLCVSPESLGATGFGTPTPGADVPLSQAFAMEVVLTFFLVFVVFGTGIDSRAPKVGGLFIGLTVALDILAGGAVSGAAMNPARHLGPALVGGELGPIWLYWIAPLLGGALAAIVYNRVLEDR